MLLHHSFVFFFQAEDGIRGGHVTGVQTCALPIFRPSGGRAPRPSARVCAKMEGMDPHSDSSVMHGEYKVRGGKLVATEVTAERSEERRVGKECRPRAWPRRARHKSK